MTAYRDFVKDFPQRCSRLIGDHQKSAWKGLEVTLLLSVFASGFVIPFERLRPRRTGAHPSDDRRKFPEFAATVDRLMKGMFADSPLAGPRPASWRVGHIASSESSGAPDAWVSRCKPILKQETAFVIECLRNAIAHGSVFVSSSATISSLIFLSRVDPRDLSRGFDVLVVSPKALKTFLLSWCDELGTSA